MNRQSKIRMLKHVLVLLACYSNCVLANSNDIIELNTTGKPPLNTPDQTGFMDRVAREAFRRIGLTLKTVQLPAERGLLSANNGIEDGEMSRIAGLEKTYTHLIQVPEEIMDWDFVAFSKPSTPAIKGWRDLQHYSVAYVNGWKILERYVPPEADTIKVNTPEQLFTMLINNHTDLIIYERWAGLLYAKKFGLNDLSINYPPLAVKKMFIYLNRKHRELVPKLAAALKQLKQDGTYHKLYVSILHPLTNKH